MDFRWVVGLTLWTLLSGPVLVQPRSALSFLTGPERATAERGTANAALAGSFKMPPPAR